jgi:hypothetical protein
MSKISGTGGQLGLAGPRRNLERVERTQARADAAFQPSAHVESMLVDTKAVVALKFLREVIQMESQRV